MNETNSKQGDPFHLDGLHVVVTGGSRGLGLAAAQAAAAAGARVTVVARSQAQVAEATERIGERAIGVVADVGDLRALDDLVSELSDAAPIDGIVHAAGIQLRKPAVEVEIEEFLRVQTVNLHAPYFFSAAVATRQIADGRPGSHVFIGSLNSSIGLPRVSPYVISKTGVVGMARAFSTEWSRHGIRANVVAPGYFATDMTQGLLANRSDHDRILSRIPMGELGEPLDVGHACVFLLADASRYVSGTLLNVDGGWLAS